ncbi:MAG TPA: hypothetical protein VMI53_01360 [Opitutaceae bacterium]|nr:hypothetical protein [Opitutaceae bacterium]
MTFASCATAPVVNSSSSSAPEANANSIAQDKAPPGEFNPQHLQLSDNLGLSSCDPRWSNYGKYLQQLIDSVQTEWDRIISNSNVYPRAGSRVTVTFLLNAEGKVVEIVKVDGDAGQKGEIYCVSAIVNPSPYGKWTPDMIASLGNEQQLTFAFYYY